MHLLTKICEKLYSFNYYKYHYYRFFPVSLWMRLIDNTLMCL